MSEPSVRMRKVNEALKEVLSHAISEHLKDPRVGFVTVTGVDASRDVRHAKVYVSVLGRQTEKRATLKGLQSAMGYLQSVINSELQLKRTPTLEFIYDDSIDMGMKMHVLLRGHESAMGLDLAAEEAELNSEAASDKAEDEASGDDSADGDATAGAGE
jgi:ribosome-binding factor A